LKRLTALVVAPFLAWGVSLATSAAEPVTIPAARPVTAPAASSPAVDAPPAPPAGAAQYSPQQVERGRYLVVNVGMCGQCHSARNANGQLEEDEFLHGGPVPLVAPRGYVKWAYKAPRLAGLPQHTDEQLVKLLTTGINRDGKEPLPPMPPFRMTQEDALAVAAFLRSVP
jgi:mono/diheme cytochrome c family protein